MESKLASSIAFREGGVGLLLYGFIATFVLGLCCIGLWALQSLVGIILLFVGVPYLS